MDYNELAAHRLMVRDQARTIAFQQAIEATVGHLDVVLDVGAGTGILSLFAAKAGAARVYAVERSPLAAEAARQLAHVNGFGDVIHVIVADIRDVILPEKVNVIVSEWMGTIGVDENMLGSVLWARDHFLADGGALIPTSVKALMAPAAPSQRVDSDFFASTPYGLDLSLLAEPSIHEMLMVRFRIRNANLGARAQTLWTTDVANDPPDSVRNPYHAELSFSMRKSAQITGFCAWFEAELAPGITLTNAPNKPATHWGQMLMPIANQQTLDKGDQLAVEVTARSVGPGPLQFDWSWCVAGGDWRHDSTGFPAPPTASEDASLDPPRSELTRLLAQLAVDPELLGQFLADPDALLAEHDLTPEMIDALKSQDEYRIAAALYDDPASSAPETSGAEDVG